LYEFGHALTARRFGIHTPRVTLLPIGGVASLERMPEKPKQELLVAAAGPAVNVIIAGLLIIGSGLETGTLFEPDRIKTLASISSDNFIYALVLINIFLVLFNAIPAFPMDGGRMLRALLSFRLSRAKATNISAVLGQLVGVAFIIFGLFGNLILALIGVFVIDGARSENAMVQQQEVLHGHKVQEAMRTHYTTLERDATLETAIEKLLAGSENDFIVLDNKQPHGVLTKERLVRAVQEHKDQSLEVSRFALSNIKSLEVNDKLNEAAKTLQQDRNRQKVFPVYDGDSLLGVLDGENLHEFIMVQST
jgi:Zn-dependent protease